MELEGRVGPIQAADGSEEPLRLGREGQVVVGDGYGKYHEATSRGNVFSVSTAVAGVAPGTALSTTPPMALWNPQNSGYVISVLQASLGYVSGTLGAGTIAFAAVHSQTTTPSGGSELTATNCNLIGNLGRPVARAWQGSTLASTPLIVRPAFILGAFLASTATIAPVLKDPLDGEFVIYPGGVLVMQGIAAAGSSPLVLFGLSWQEVALLQA